MAAPPSVAKAFVATSDSDSEKPSGPKRSQSQTMGKARLRMVTNTKALIEQCPSLVRQGQVKPMLRLQSHTASFIAASSSPVVRMKQIDISKVRGSSFRRVLSSAHILRRHSVPAEETEAASSEAAAANSDLKTPLLKAPVGPVPPTPRSALHYIKGRLSFSGLHGQQQQEQEQQQPRATSHQHETVDPYLRERPKSKISNAIWLMLPAITVVCWVLLLIGLGIDRATGVWKYTTPAGEKVEDPLWWRYDIESFIWTMLNPTPSHSRNLMHGVIPTMMFLFGMMITFIGIILQFAAERTTSHVNNLVIKEPAVVGILAFSIVTNIFAFGIQMAIGSPILPASASAVVEVSSSSSSTAANLTNSSLVTADLLVWRGIPTPFLESRNVVGKRLDNAMWASDANVTPTPETGGSPGIVDTGSLKAGPSMYPRFGVFLCTFIVSIVAVMIVPFIAYLSNFLESEEVITKLMTHGLNAVVSQINTPNPTDEQTQYNQRKVANAAKYIMDTAESSLNDNNKNLCSEALDALCSYCMHYVNLKDKLQPSWNKITPWLKKSMDFIILNEDSVKDLVIRGLWVEWKILRQYQRLFQDALVLESRELCYHICINTRIIGETGGALFQLPVADLAMKFFNTYLRQAINVNDVKVVYNTLFQYRRMAERFVDRERGTSHDLALRAWKTAKFMLYYGYACQGKKLFFIVETVAQDLRVLCQAAIISAIPYKGKGRAKAGYDPERAIFRDVHDRLLEVLLSLYDISGNSPSQKGVTKALVMLATFYVSEQQIGQARKIQKQIRNLSKESLFTIREELLHNNTRDFWEVSERGQNFAFLDASFHPHLRTFYSWFDWCTDQIDDPHTWHEFWESNEGRQLKLGQEMENFKTGMSDDEMDYDGGDDDEEDDGAGALDLEGELDAAPGVVLGGRGIMPGRHRLGGSGAAAAADASCSDHSSSNKF
eukprot:m51a1_g12745 hypothetical protein (947) ;mRNA; f:345-3525